MLRLFAERLATEAPVGEDEFVELDEEGQPKAKPGAAPARRGRTAAVKKKPAARKRADAVEGEAPAADAPAVEVESEADILAFTATRPTGRRHDEAEAE